MAIRLPPVSSAQALRLAMDLIVIPVKNEADTRAARRQIGAASAV
jgi:hypothetical protein